MEPTQPTPAPTAPAPPPPDGPRRWTRPARGPGRRVVFGWALAGGLGLLGLGLLFSRLGRTRVSFDLCVSALEWESADEPGKDLDWFGLAIAANDSAALSLPPARIVSNPVPGVRFDSTGFLTLRPARPYSAVRVHKVAFPPGAAIQLAQPDGGRLRLAVSAGPAAGAQPLRWHLSFQKKLYDNPLTGRVDTLTCGDATDDIPCELEMQKTLGASGSYVFDFTQPHEWQAPARLMARTLAFRETNTAGTEAISSVLGGTVRLLDTNDAPLKLAERDVVRVRFEEPVEMFIKSTPQGLLVHVDGVASELLGGPKILADDNDLRPLRIKHYYDQSPYIWAWLLVLVPLVLGPYVARFSQRQ